MFVKNFLLSNFFFILLGIIFFLMCNFLVSPKELSANGLLVASLLILMGLWWLTNAIPLSITALLPLILIPIFSDISITEVAKPYANPIIFLLLGGFILGLGLQKSNLHKRFAIYILMRVGSQKKNILFGFITSTAFFSMWLSNTATCLLMLPIALSIIEKFKQFNDDIFEKILLLSIAYSSSIGGMSTLIGTAPNAIFAGFMSENFEVEINFLSWMIFSLPLVITLLIILYFFLSSFIKDKDFLSIPNTNFLKKEYEILGKINLEEKISLFIISLTILLWIFKKYINLFFGISLSDSSISLFGACLFFIIPSGKFKFILDSSWYTKIPWNILILFGGGLSLANLVTSSGLASWTSNFLYILNNVDIFFIIIFLAFLISMMTEITSNTATTLLFLPIMATFAVNYGQDIFVISLPIVIAASCAFMMPIATPPNAIIFSTNKIKIFEMASTGFLLNILAVILSTIWIYFFSYLLY